MPRARGGRPMLHGRRPDMADLLRDVIDRNRAGTAAAIPSVCSAHPDVLRASLSLAQAKNRAIVIEATSNQVNQFGGYTGMTPADFARFVWSMAEDTGCDRDRIVLGGDHLGPQVWRSGPAEDAMYQAQAMVAAYVRAGFSKIHLDCSEGCAGEPAQVSDAIAADRAAVLAVTCDGAAADPSGVMFVIGTEVPPPGGARADDSGDIVPTTPAAAAATLRAHDAAFARHRVAGGTSRVGALVVQGGVEFSPMQVHHLPPERDPALRSALADWPGMCLEAHSTDYQHPAAYPRLAEFGFAFQKVGPALTFAWRQAVYAMDHLRLLSGRSKGLDLRDTMERLMLAEPASWQAHYHGTNAEVALARHVGLADRIRYYWAKPDALAAVAELFADIDAAPPPLSLLWQGFAPAVLDRAEALRGSMGGSLSRSLAAASVQLALDPYFFDETGPMQRGTDHV